jgi:hypothetical protein
MQVISKTGNRHCEEGVFPDEAISQPVCIGQLFERLLRSARDDGVEVCLRQALARRSWLSKTPTGIGIEEI